MKTIKITKIDPRVQSLIKFIGEDKIGESIFDYEYSGLERFAIDYFGPLYNHQKEIKIPLTKSPGKDFLCYYVVQKRPTTVTLIYYLNKDFASNYFMLRDDDDDKIKNIVTVEDYQKIINGFHT